ncbi:MAG: methylmalonyl-CoA decarboxylase, partial [Candidatus Lambdaproteobacteria bacterium]|nr:methylmalonyl-CoA decarboxylase [Candidatus Lambdaproteobacteria bacterium]
GARMEADCLLAWPSADVSFMAPEGAVSVVYGRKIKDAPDPEAARAQYLDEINKLNKPWEAAGLNLVDDVIDPRETRIELIRALERARGPSGQAGRSERLLANWPTGI